MGGRNTSTDAMAGLILLALALICLIVVLVFGALLVIPILAAIGVGKAIHWYATRPSPANADSKVGRIQRFPSPEEFAEVQVNRLFDTWGDDLPEYSIYDNLHRIAIDLYEAEDLVNPPLPLPAAARDTIEEGRYRDQLLMRAKKTANPGRTLALMHAALGSMASGLQQRLPPIAYATPEEFHRGAAHLTPLATIPLLDAVPDIGQAIINMAAPFHSAEVRDLNLFAAFRRQFERNVYAASGSTNGIAPNKLLLPDEHDGTPREIVRLYLRGTPLEELFEAELPFSFSDAQRFEHAHVIGGSGHGKTQLLQHLIFHDLTRPEPPALIVIDSQGDMLRKIERLDLFTRSPLSDRLVIIDPEDVEYPPALNMFDTANARLSGYSLAHREQIEASVIELYNYVFGALAAELTQKQGTAFAYVVRLMLSVPGATIHTLRELMEDAAPSIERSPFADHIARLDPTSQAFFQNQFFSKSFVQTKQQIARRLYGVLQVPAFDRMFSPTRNKLDMFEAMQEGKVVLVNTSKALLKADASALFGRYMIALTMKAAFERVAVSVRTPAFLIVDEAAEYFDETLETLLSQARKFNLGALFAHQHLDQLSPALRSSVAANTTIKLAGGVSDRDARAISSDMRTSAEFIASMRKHAHSTEFACYVRNMTANAVRLRIPFGTIEAQETMSARAFEDVLARNRARYAVRRERPRPAATDPDTARPVARDHEPTSPSVVPKPDEWRS